MIGVVEGGDCRFAAELGIEEEEGEEAGGVGRRTRPGLYG